MGDFDLRALAAALDEQRKARGLSWSGVIREMTGADEHQRRTLSASTVRGIGSRAVAEADGVLAMLRWLKRSPESFIVGHREPEGAQLPESSGDKVLRFDTRNLFRALDPQRVDRRMTWEQVAIDTGWTVSGFTRSSDRGQEFDIPTKRTFAQPPTSTSPFHSLDDSASIAR